MATANVDLHLDRYGSLLREVTFTVRVIVPPTYRFRWWLCRQLFRLGAWIAGVGMQFE